MNDDAVHIRIHFRREGSLLQDGVNVTIWDFKNGEPVYNNRTSQFIFFRRGNKELEVRIPRSTLLRWTTEYSIDEGEWDPRRKSYKICVFGSDENT